MKDSQAKPEFANHFLVFSKPDITIIIYSVMKNKKKEKEKEGLFSVMILIVI